MTDLDRGEKNWLIKSSTRILGPCSIDEIAALLLKKHISIIDEVRQPSGRWKYIREHRIFDEVVQTLRTEQENSGDLTLTSATQTMTLTSATVTKTDHIFIEDSMTPTPTPPPIARSDQHNPFEQVGVKDVTAREKTLQNTGVRPVGSTYGDVRDQRVRKQITKSQNAFRLILLAVSIGVLILLGVLKLRDSSKREQGYEALIEQALRYKALQLYDRSLVAYKKATLNKEVDENTQSQMALILIVLDRQNVLGRRILEKTFTDEKANRNRQVDAGLGIGISYMMEGSLKEAEESLQKVLILEPNNFIAKVNLAVLALRKGESREALKQFKEIAQRHPLHPLVSIGRAIALLQSNPTRDEARDLALEVRADAPKLPAFKHELSLMEAALWSFDGVNPNFNSAIDRFLSEQPPMSNMVARDLRLDWRVMDTEALERTCRDMMTRVTPTSHAKAARAVCLSEAGREADARRFFDEALIEAPKDPLLLFVQAVLLERVARRSEAMALLKLPDLSDLPSVWALTGQICLDTGDLNCAQTNFQKIYDRDDKDLRAIAGLATVDMKTQKVADAMSLARKGLDLDPSYLPLIELRELKETSQ